MEASRIQDQTAVQVVFFKMSLTTGWDCPRAEVMMSFRKAKDHTLIAQLVGRMIRTPLTRRIEASEVLNTVELFLPHYDEQALSSILDELQNPDAESGLGTQAVVGREMVIYPRAKGMEAALDLAQSLPSYSIARVPELPPVKRALRLASRLTLEDELDPSALDEARDACLNVLLELRARLQKTDPNFLERVRERGELEITTIGVQIGGAVTTQRGTSTVALTAENIDDLFDRCGRVLGAGEGLHKEFWKRVYDETDPLRAKLELHEVLSDEQTLATLEQVGNRTFDVLYKRNKRKIEKLPSAAREEYNRLAGATKAPAEIMRTLPPEIAVRKEDRVWSHHLYADTRGEFRVKLNSWEKAVLDEELKRPGFVGWLRNVDRKEWSIAVPYDYRGVRPFYPDFVIIRREDGELVADLMDPHNSKLDDTWAKAKGLAAYADKHTRWTDEPLQSVR